MATEQSEETQTSDETDCPSEPEHTPKHDYLASPKTRQTDRRRAKSLPEDLHQDDPSSHSGCPTRKKVQFADMMGLSLANVRHIDTSDDSGGLQRDLKRCLVPAFDMPVSLPGFELKHRRQGVALESVTISASEVKGVIRVMQRPTGGDVGVRYTVNKWLTFSDVRAASRRNEENALPWRQFDFTLRAPLCFDEDSSVHFAVYCRTGHEEHWDNNDGQNYTLRTQTT